METSTDQGDPAVLVGRRELGECVCLSVFHSLQLPLFALCCILVNTDLLHVILTDLFLFCYVVILSCVCMCARAQLDQLAIRLATYQEQRLAESEATLTAVNSHLNHCLRYRNNTSNICTFVRATSRYTHTLSRAQLFLVCSRCGAALFILCSALKWGCVYSRMVGSSSSEDGITDQSYG